MFLSLGEAEYYTVLKGASIGLGVESLAGDFALQMSVTSQTDSSAAKGISGRKGLGRTKHRDVQYVETIRGDTNIVDLLTKHLAEDKVNQFMKDLGYKFAEEHHRLALSTRAPVA